MSTELLEERQRYEEEIARKQQAHLEKVYDLHAVFHWKPCQHDSCPECFGTGVRRNGTPCAHTLSCDCPKCTPSYEVLI